MLNEWINPIYLEENKIKQLKEQFLNGKPFSHLSLPNFLNETKAIELLNSLKKEKYYKEENDLYKFLRTIDFKNTNNKTILEFRNFLLKNETIKFFEKLLNENIQKNKLDLHSLKLKNTNYLLCHDDMVQNRKFAFIFNLSKNWTKEDGGKLELFSSKNKEPQEIEKSIIPQFNQFNIFKVTPTSFHQIEEVLKEKERISISGWFY